MGVLHGDQARGQEEAPLIELGDDRALRPVAAGDVDELFALTVAEHDHLARWMWWAVDPAREGTAAFVESATTDDNERAFAIVEHGRIIGTIGLTIQPARATAEVGYWLVADAEGRGIVSQALDAVLGLAFGELGLHRVELLAAVGNDRSLRVAQRNGFVREGVLREAILVGDGFQDAVIHSMLAGEWRAPAR